MFWFAVKRRIEPLMISMKSMPSGSAKVLTWRATQGSHEHDISQCIVIALNKSESKRIHALHRS
jgi:hypothetical protein